jgi:hypothetical protein
MSTTSKEKAFEVLWETIAAVTITIWLRPVEKLPLQFTVVNEDHVVSPHAVHPDRAAEV